MMIGIDDVFVLSVTKGVGAANDGISVYNTKPDLYELMEVISEDIDWLTFRAIKHLAEELYREGYVAYGFHEYALKNKAVQYG